MILSPAPRTKEDVATDVTRNYLLLADFVVGKSRPVKSYKDFATLTLLQHQNFSPIHKGDRKVPLECAVKACEIFGCSFDFMFGNLGEMFGKDDVMKKVLDLEERMNYLENKFGVKSRKNSPQAAPRKPQKR